MWSWFLLRLLVGLSIVTVLFLSQRFWYRALWRVTGHWGRTTLRVGVRLLYLSGWLLIIASIADSVRQDRGRAILDRHAFHFGPFLYLIAKLSSYQRLLIVHRVGHGLVQGDEPNAARGETVEDGADAVGGDRCAVDQPDVDGIATEDQARGGVLDAQLLDGGVHAGLAQPGLGGLVAGDHRACIGLSELGIVEP